MTFSSGMAASTAIEPITLPKPNSHSKPQQSPYQHCMSRLLGQGLVGSTCGSSGASSGWSASVITAGIDSVDRSIAGSMGYSNPVMTCGSSIGSAVIESGFSSVVMGSGRGGWRNLKWSRQVKSTLAATVIPNCRGGPFQESTCLAEYAFMWARNLLFIGVSVAGLLALGDQLLRRNRIDRPADFEPGRFAAAVKPT